MRLDGDDFGAKVVNFDFGVGRYSLVFSAASSKLSDLAADPMVTGLENITAHATNAAQEITPLKLVARLYVRRPLLVQLAHEPIGRQAADTSIDLSTLVTGDVATSMAGMTYITNASGNSSAITIMCATCSKIQ